METSHNVFPFNGNASYPILFKTRTEKRLKFYSLNLIARKMRHGLHIYVSYTDLYTVLILLVLQLRYRI